MCACDTTSELVTGVEERPKLSESAAEHKWREEKTTIPS